MTEINIFPKIPGIEGEHVEVRPMLTCGPGVYQVPIDGVEKKEYLAYLDTLEKEGYQKVVDNGDGLGGCVYTASYTKDSFLLTVSYMERQHRLYLAIGQDIPISRHLFKNGTFEDENKVEKTKIHMQELWWFGCSIIIQLKNGHFVICDGGLRSDAKYLVDYLESLVPEGEKPIIEAWLVTHAHADHCGAIQAFEEVDRELGSRICVEEVFYSEPGERVHKKITSGLYDLAVMKRAIAKRLYVAEHQHPQIYRPQTGQRYYFDDITMDILHCQEQLPLEQYECQDYEADYNDSSTWFLFTIEGQKILISGDGDIGSMKVIMDTYDKEFLKVDMMTLPHHGFNTWDEFTDYCTVGTLLVTARGSERFPERRNAANDYLRSQVEEWVPGWGDGSLIFTFPYEKGSYETLPNREWIYHEGKERK